jgi:hypothetical protein
MRHGADNKSARLVVLAETSRGAEVAWYLKWYRESIRLSYRLRYLQSIGSFSNSTMKEEEWSTSSFEFTA